MLVYNANYKDVLPLFKETTDQATFVSFDCEMTGVTWEMKTDGTKFDTQEYRYYKTREVISKYSLVQIAFTFYTPHLREGTEVYIERTFTFYLLKNSKYKYISNDIFSNEMLCHPATLKFLNDNNFDINVLISKGISFNKLAFTDKIRNIIKNEKFLIGSNATFLSKTNEANWFMILRQIAEFLMRDDSSSSEKKQSDSFTLLSHQSVVYLWGCNLKSLLKFTNFNLIMDKTNPCRVIVQKTKKKLSTVNFITAYASIDNFYNWIKSNPNIVYQSRHQLAVAPTEENIEEWVNDELGFSRFISCIIERKLPIVGHNIYFDLMFIYDKLIDDLPSDFFTFKTNVHKLFPFIYDTKAISMELGKFDNTKLESWYKNICKSRYDTYTNFCADVANGFSLYHDVSTSMLHDAGYDSVITGRCFVLMNKAVENNYNVDPLKKVLHGVGGEVIKEEVEIVIKKGYVNMDMFSQFVNMSIMSIVDSPLAKIFWNVDLFGIEDFLGKEREWVEKVFANVYFVKMDPTAFDTPVTIYDIARMFENERYGIWIVKNDWFSAFVHMIDDQEEGKQKESGGIDWVVKDIAEKNKTVIEKVIKGAEFYKNFKEEVGF